ncbi:MauE/DoxX family redox-associated membrane protein [Longitalea luteola]|uniref:MauE/DoxX family redox-associated membrane protein n=1 Tax=Longitalea luteola TaxID=2812563 RepID=UPI001A96B7EB|nr:MauE/DoxX family redox-associated membrane protein [Longitalea luteola]
MKKSNVALGIICTLNIILFVYAATAKLLDYYNFQFGLSESPFIAPFASELAWGVPVSELLIAAFMAIPALRLTGLYACCVVMSLFTIYIAAMLLFGSEIPCSCGGILEEMSWSAHVVFNSAFVALSAWGIYLERKKRRTLPKLPALA